MAEREVTIAHAVAERRLPSVAIVIPTHCGSARLRTVVEPLLLDPATTEVVVVVDGPDAASVDVLCELAARDPRVRPLVVPHGGASAARAAGVAHARSDVVLLLDDDVVAAGGLVSGHARHHAERNGSVVLGYTPTVVPESPRRGNFTTRLYARDYDDAFAAFDSDPSLVLHGLWGANVSLSRDDCLRVGLLDPDYRERYHEDRDFGLRCLEGGLEGVFDRSLLAFHHHSRSLPGWLADARSQGVARVLMHERHPLVLGPLPNDAFAEDLPFLARMFLRVCRRPAPYRFAKAGAIAVVYVTGTLRLWPIEMRAGQLLRRIEQQAGGVAARSRTRLP
jgi:glycosyltransferase involved in cell wall biosynthesis